MAGMMKSMTCIVLIAAVLIATVTPLAEAAVGCGMVVSYFNSCVPYVTSKGSLGRCCNGVKGLYNAAQTTPNSCLKSLAGSYIGVDYDKAAGLPGQCGVNTP